LSGNLEGAIRISDFHSIYLVVHAIIAANSYYRSRKKPSAFCRSIKKIFWMEKTTCLFIRVCILMHFDRKISRRGISWANVKALLLKSVSIKVRGLGKGK
jgi:hypothetical protein